jgi:hypothetical protein
MKKLLVLAMVLGIAGISSAVLTASGAGAVSDGITILNTETLSYVGPGNGFDITLHAGDGLACVDTTVFGTPTAGSVTYVGAFDPKACRITGVDFVAQTGQFVWFSNLGLDGVGVLTYVDNATQESMDINVIPEPMTMALLGLGGLFIRRKK